ncbi:hypothetical protein N9H82_06055 [Flavobacteriaceae bacterium]|jgi:hypothetical protein|nr:hypothetical protein [Flavobacteriaceae bacterium]|tara:strand:+ start:550 stop:864 length:315 start_codon:yes stop_codon:yes gene_type:complete
MKKLLILFASITILLSCGSIVPISAVNNKVEIGMTKTEFLAVALERAKKDAMTETYYVYRIDQYNLDGYIIDSMFYYFRNSDDKLFEVNAGTKATDVNLNINNN